MLREQFNQALKSAMREKDSCALATVRLILAALKDRDIAARSKGHPEGISDEDILSLLQTMIKQRRESIALYEQGGRLELAEREAQEIGVIERFLPKQMEPAEVETAVRDVIGEVGAEGLKEMGKVMAALKERYAGRMDFSKASAVAKQHLT